MHLGRQRRDRRARSPSAGRHARGNQALRPPRAASGISRRVIAQSGEWIREHTLMDPLTGEFNFTRLEKVTFGPGKAASLGQELERRGLKRALVVTGKTLGASRLLERVTAAAGPRLAGVFKGASQHVPSHTVAALVAEYKRIGADSMVSFGGGSPIDTVKVAAKRILEGSRSGAAAPHTIDFEAADVVGGPDLIHIAMPTTLSAGEFTPIGGITDESSHVKGGVIDPRLIPRTIILDPELT